MNKTIPYSYDKGGNLQTVKEYGYTTAADLSRLTPNVTNTYSYSDSNWKDKLTSYNGQTITYDPIGNPLSYYNGYSFTWKNGRQLATAVKSGQSVSYTYNPEGIRTSKTVNGVTTSCFLEGDRVVKETNGSDTFWFYYDASGSVISFELNGAAYFYVKNLQGDITEILNSNGTLVVEYSYDAWGKLISITGSGAATVGVKNPYRYRGYRYDTETGLYYLQSRYYDPEVKRFVNSDCTSDPGEMLYSINLFIAFGNNPICNIDINGRNIIDIINYIVDEAVNGYKEVTTFLEKTSFTGSLYCSVSVTIGYITYSGQFGGSIDHRGRTKAHLSSSAGASTSAIGASFTINGSLTNADDVGMLLGNSTNYGYDISAGVICGNVDCIMFNNRGIDYTGVSAGLGITTPSIGTGVHSGVSYTDAFPKISFSYEPCYDVLEEAECL